MCACACVCVHVKLVCLQHNTLTHAHTHKTKMAHRHHNHDNNNHNNKEDAHGDDNHHGHPLESKRRKKSKFAYDLHAKEIERVEKNKWLNDTVIDVYSRYTIRKELSDVPPDKGIETVRVISCLLVKKIIDGEYSTVAKQTKINVKTTKLIVMPVCTKHHWILFVYHLKFNTYFFMDSSNGMFSRAEVTDMLKSIARYIVCTGLPEYTDQPSGGLKIESQQQNDSTNCGVFVLYNLCLVLKAYRDGSATNKVEFADLVSIPTSVLTKRPLLLNPRQYRIQIANYLNKILSGEVDAEEALRFD